MGSPADDELAAAPVSTGQVLALLAAGLVLLFLGVVTRPPRWLLDDAGDHVVNGNGNGHGADLDADVLIRASTNGG